MRSRQVLLIPPIREQICQNLTFEEAINLRDALNLPNLKCSFRINDPDGQVIILKGVNNDTISAHYMITKFGSKNTFVNSSKLNNLPIIHILLENNIDLEAPDFAGNLALISAVRYNHLETAKLLIEHGANVNASSFEGTPLYLAVSKGNLDMVKFLLENGADVNMLHRFRSVLIVAAASGYFEIVKALFQYSTPDINLSDWEGKTALMYALQNNRSELVKYLKQHGAH